MNKFGFCIAIMLLSFTGSAFAQSEWSLEQCIQYALKHNSGYNSISLEQERKQNELSIAKGAYLPSVNANAGYFMNQGKVQNFQTGELESKTYQTTDINLLAEVDIFNGFYNKYNARIHQHQLDKQISDIEAQRNYLALSVAEAYMQILYSNEFVNAAKNQIEITENELNKTKIHVESGTKTKAELFRLQAQLESERSELVSQEGKATIAKLNLMQLMEFTPDSTQTVEDFSIVSEVTIDEIPALLPADSIYKAAKTLPEITATHHQLETAREQIALSKTMYYPDLKAQAMYGTNYSSLAETSIGDHLTAKAGVTLRIPIFNKYQARTVVANSKIDYLQAEKQIIETEKSIRFQVETAYQDAITAQRRLEVEQKSVDFYQESFRFAQAQLDAGTITALDFNTEKTALATAEAKLIRARYEVLYHTLMLNYFASGIVKL